MARRKTKAETIVAALKSWDRKDSDLSGMSDPLSNDGPSDEVVKMWERSFYTALVNDREYWAERNSRLGLDKDPDPDPDPDPVITIKTDDEILIELMNLPRPPTILERVFNTLMRRLRNATTTI